jgi:regulator of sigma E protease
VLCLIGFNAPPAIDGSVLPHSPAQQAGLRVGDRILYLDDKYQHGFTHLTLNTALAEAGQSIPVYVERADGTREHLTITPRQIEGDTNGFLMLGVEQARELRAPEKVPSDAEKLLVSELTSADTLALRPGDIITEINGQPVDVQDIHKLDQALQTSGGQPVQLTVKSADGSTRPVEVHPRFTRTFNELARPLNFFGMLPRPQIASVDPRSPARGKILPGDVIIKISSAEGEKSNPTTEELINWLNQAGNNGKNVTLTVLRGKETVEVTDITPSMKVASGRYGLGIGLEYDEDHAVVAGIEKESAAALAGIPESFEVLSVNDQPVTSWHDVKRILDNASADQPVVITGVTEARNERQFTLNVTEAQLAYVRDLRYTHSLFLRDYYEPRQTNNPLIAAWWGVVETRDFVLQFYLTLQRMFQGSVSYKNMMGPVGIFHAGTMFAERGTDWLIWFLSMISANLAVVNFLPIPIVDGGLFTFLIIEKIQGRPLSARTQSIAQVVGLAVLLSVFLLVTFQDITRLL